MKRSLERWLLAAASVAVLALCTPLTIATGGPAGAAPPPANQLQFDETQAVAANGPAIDADELRVCGANDGSRFLAEILQGNPFDFKIPYRLGDVVAGNPKPTSLAHKQMMVSGTVVDSVTGSGDFPFDHPFGSDFNMDVQLDAPYAFMSQVAGQVTNIPMHTELSAGLAPHTVQPPGPATGETWADSGMRARSNFQAGYLPQAGDRVLVMGEWVNDCGHPPFQTELHEISFMAWAHTEGTKTVVQTFGVPYRPTQLYNKDPQYGNKVNNQARFNNLFTQSFPQGLITSIINLNGGGYPPYNTADHLESWGLVDAPTASPVDWTICAPPGTTGTKLNVNYDFVARPGVQISATGDDATGCATVKTLRGTNVTPDPPMRTCVMPWAFLNQVAAEEAGVPGLDVQAQIRGFLSPPNKYKADPDPIMDCYDPVQGPSVSTNLTGQNVTIDPSIQSPFWGRVELSWQAEAPTTTTSSSSSSSTSSSTASSASTTAPAEVTMTVTPGTMPVGGTFKLVSQGWKPNTPVAVSIDGGATVLGTVTANADGSIDTSFTLPTSVLPGDHQVTLDGTMSDGTVTSLSAKITVTAAATTALAATPTTTATGTLPTTGSNIYGIVAIGSLLCMAGLLLVALTRSRRPATA